MLNRGSAIAVAAAAVLLSGWSEPPAQAQPIQDSMYVDQVTQGQGTARTSSVKHTGMYLFMGFIFLAGGTIYFIRKSKPKKNQKSPAPVPR